jgi:ABC-2 type transport system ATP-binding protein
VVEIREAVARLAREKAVILSTHVLPEASLLCSRVLIVSRGRLVADGAPDELERMLAGGIRVKVVCGAADPMVVAAVERVFHQLPGLSGFARVVAESERIAWVVDLKHADGVPRLVEALVRAGCALHEVAPQRQGLEGVFLALVRHDPALATPPATADTPGAS